MSETRTRGLGGEPILDQGSAWLYLVALTLLGSSSSGAAASAEAFAWFPVSSCGVAPALNQFLSPSRQGAL
jgi:hypothetical protein